LTSIITPEEITGTPVAVTPPGFSGAEKVIVVVAA